MTGQNAWAFLLIGNAFRVIRLLGLDSTRESEALKGVLDATELESARRLVWSCYLLDAQIGSGVDKNLSWRGDAPQIPLPCREEAFSSGSVPRDAYEEGDLILLNGLPKAHRMNLRANILYIMCLRSESLRFVQ
jgi:hypothetical protein